MRIISEILDEVHGEEKPLPHPTSDICAADPDTMNAQQQNLSSFNSGFCSMSGGQLINDEGVGTHPLFIFLGGGFLIFSIVKDVLRNRRPPVITNVAADPEGKDKWVLGSIQDIEGSSWVLMPLISERKDLSAADPGMRKGLHSYSDGYSTPSRNVLFVNQDTRDMHWLFPRNSQLVTRIETVSQLPRYEKGRVADAILYHVVSSDTNGDGKLSSDDAIELAVSKTDGSGYKIVVKSVDRIFGVKTANPEAFVILYQSGGRGYVSAVRIADMTVIDTKEMPQSEKTP